LAVAITDMWFQDLLSELKAVVFFSQANEYDINKAAKFMVYYGPDRRIGLKSMSSGAFVRTAIVSNDTLVVAGPDVEPSSKDLILFEHEFYETPSDYPTYEVESEPDIRMGPFEKLA